MGKDLSDKVSKIMEQMQDMPVIDTRVYKSRDGGYIINEVRIKTIKPTNYYAAIVANEKGAYEKKGEKDDERY
jgi:hypothetical protein